MEMVLTNGFYEMTQNEMELVDGGSGKQAACIFLGVVGLAWSVPTTILNPGVGLVLAGSSLACIDAGL
jgi:lactobin A/cerein 7B family class IIb bacteriocin